MPRNGIAPTSAQAETPHVTGAQRVLSLSQRKRTHLLRLDPRPDQASRGRGQHPPTVLLLRSSTNLLAFSFHQPGHRGAQCSVEKPAEQTNKKKAPATRLETRGDPTLKSSHRWKQLFTPRCQPPPSSIQERKPLPAFNRQINE